MSEPSLNDLGVTARAVSTVEDDVLADAHARATVAEQDDHELAVAAVEDQLVKLRAEEQSLRKSVRDRAPQAKLRALRKRMDVAVARKQALLDAHEERKRLSLNASVGIESDDKPAQGESHRDFLIRTGKLTPFQGQHGYERQPADIEPTRRRVTLSLPSENLKNADIDYGGLTKEKCEPDVNNRKASNSRQQKHSSNDDSNILVEDESASSRARKRKRARSNLNSDEDEYNPELSSSNSESEDDDSSFNAKKTSNTRARKKKRVSCSTPLVSESGNDEGHGQKGSLTSEGNVNEENNITLDEEEEVEFEGGLRVPASIYDRLFAYQQTGVSMLPLQR